MAVTMDLTAWTGTLVGLYMLFAGIGALRNANAWRTMIDEIDNSPGFQVVVGALELLIGAMIYLANPWAPADILACVLKAVGGLMMIEALAVVGFFDIYAQFWLRTLSHMHRGWAMLTSLVGVALTIAGTMRFP